MKHFNIKTVYPHLISIFIFLIISILFCLPAFQGMILEQHDILAVEGMIKNSKDHQLLYGNLPLWNTNMFSGMPNFQILFSWEGTLVDFKKILALGLPKPSDFFFIACVSFYILGLTFRMKPHVALLAALGYAFSTYNPVIINAGHDTKMLALAYAPGVLAGFQLIFSKKYWIGLGVTALYMTMELTSNHPQLTFYVAIIVFFMGVFHLIQWIRQGEWKHLGKSALLGLICIAIGLGNAAPTLMNTYDYAKYTMRGGKDIESKDGSVVATKTKALDYDYASMWSIRKSEIVSIFMPTAFGGSSSETLPSNEKFIEHLVKNNVPENAAAEMAEKLPAYWGGLESTAGTAYMGVVAFILFFLGLVITKSEHRWWIISAFAAGAILAFGKYFSEINELIFNSLPFYNKFRAPSMALVIPQLVVPLMAGLFVNDIVEGKIDLQNKKNLKKIGYSLGTLLGILLVIYLFNSYDSDMIDNQIMQAFGTQQVGSESLGKIVIDALIAERKNMFLDGIMKVLIFSLFVFGVLYLYGRKILSAFLITIAFILVNTVDLLLIDKKYLNENNYIDGDTYIASNFTPTKADELILQDKDPHFRVFNLSGDRFSETKTSYFHRSIGGYHAAKLRNYQDLIETKFSEPGLNKNLINILDAKYLIIPPQSEDPTYRVQKNDSALGAAWFVENLIEVSNQVKELQYLDSINPSNTAVVEKNQGLMKFKFEKDSSKLINLVKYRNDTSVFQTITASEQYAVFSEIYYPNGWNAYIDGKPVAHNKVNYLLRGLIIPAGKHEVQFIFEPRIYKLSSNIAYFFGWSLYLCLIVSIGGTYLSIKKRK